MRKGADVLSKWVGSPSVSSGLLFAEAQKRQPAIIFFDEIDGLAPVRSSKTDQIHNSIVATLLALMDGLDSRGRVVVLGATNRVDAIDGALRRPGRFDRELAFPPAQRRRAFRDSQDPHARVGKTPPSLLLEQLAARCVGYCGADLKALCTEAAVHALRRRYPQIYESDDKLLIDPGQILPGRVDFRAAMEAITPASHRSAQAHARPLGPLRQPSWVPRWAKPWRRRFSRFPPAMAANADKNAASGSSGSSKPPTASMVFDLDDLDDDDEDDGLELLEELDGGAGGSKEAPAVVRLRFEQAGRGSRRRRRFVGRLRRRCARDGGARVPQLPARAAAPFAAPRPVRQRAGAPRGGSAPRARGVSGPRGGASQSARRRRSIARRRLSWAR